MFGTDLSADEFAALRRARWDRPAEAPPNDATLSVVPMSDLRWHAGMAYIVVGPDRAGYDPGVHLLPIAEAAALLGLDEEEFHRLAWLLNLPSFRRPDGTLLTPIHLPIQTPAPAPEVA